MQIACFLICWMAMKHHAVMQLQNVKGAISLAGKPQHAFIELLINAVIIQKGTKMWLSLQLIQLPTLLVKIISANIHFLHKLPHKPSPPLNYCKNILRIIQPFRYGLNYCQDNHFNFDKNNLTHFSENSRIIEGDYLSPSVHFNSVMISVKEELFPFCIVWTTIPIISWLLPFVGHVGICNSKGIVCDFIGYHINYRRLSFNTPLKYVQLDPASAEQYDEAIVETNARFQNEAHDLCCNNCHHHVADVLNRIGYEGRSDWGQVGIWWACMGGSEYTGCSSFFRIYLPFLFLLAGAGVVAYVVSK